MAFAFQKIVKTHQYDEWVCFDILGEMCSQSSEVNIMIHKGRTLEGEI